MKNENHNKRKGPANPLLQLVYRRAYMLRNNLADTIWDSSRELTVDISPEHESFQHVGDLATEPFEPVKPNSIFGDRERGPRGEFPWSIRWFKVAIPAPGVGEAGRRYVRWDADGEFTLYLDGKPWYGLDPMHREAPVPDRECTLYIQGGLWQTGIGTKKPDAMGFRFRRCQLGIRNETGWKVFHDLDVLVQLLENWFPRHNLNTTVWPGHLPPLGKIPKQLRRLLYLVGRSLDVLECQGLESFSRVMDELYGQLPSDPMLGEISYVGHAHIDLMWLWPERVTYKKAVHTYATQLRLMEKYPEYTFTMSQPPLLYAIKEQEPELAQEIEKRIHEGRWEFTGGLEVEADTQLPVGEGLARSIIYGQERIAAIRGKPSDLVWLPDVFGYSQCLPQLFALAGIRSFFTTKMTWSQITRLPHSSFVWQGPDGSKVLAHLCSGTYNSECKPHEAMDTVEEYRQSYCHDEILVPAGYGDGGGGATEAHLERARRMQNLTNVPRQGWTTAEAFFDRLQKVRDELPRYTGELYLEFHRGVQTSQSDFKANMRAVERSLQCYEAVQVLTGSSALPARAWLRYLFMQFHDALPGTSINSVYKEANPELVDIAAHNMAEARRLWNTEEDGLTIVNTLAINRQTVVQLPPGNWEAHGNVLCCQHSDQGSLASIRLKGLESVTLLPATQGSRISEIHATPTLLDNGVAQAYFSEQGWLKELIVEGTPLDITEPAGFWLHHESPTTSDAWNINHPSTWLGSRIASTPLAVSEQGPVRAVLSGSCPLGDKSLLTVRYIFEAGSRELHVECDVDWQEDHRWLRYRMQTGYTGPMARFGAPFGSVDRSQHEGLDAQEGMWEVPASRWASVLDGGGNGLAIITEAKYGFSARNGELNLSLLRAPVEPDPLCDRGNHTIRFAIGQHHNLSSGEHLSTAARAETLYTPPLMVEKGLSRSIPFTLSNIGSVVPSWVMPARTSDGYLIRLHETAGQRQTVILQLHGEANRVERVNLLEEAQLELPVSDDNIVKIPIGVQEIVTVRVQNAL